MKIHKIQRFSAIFAQKVYGKKVKYKNNMKNKTHMSKSGIIGWMQWPHTGHISAPDGYDYGSLFRVHYQSSYAPFEPKSLFISQKQPNITNKQPQRFFRDSSFGENVNPCVFIQFFHGKIHSFLINASSSDTWNTTS